MSHAGEKTSFADQIRASARVLFRVIDPGEVVSCEMPGVADRLAGCPVRLIAFGKASAAMARAAVAHADVGARVTGGVVVVVPGSDVSGLGRPLEVVFGDHPIPTDRSMAAADRVLGEIERAGPDDGVLVLVSGGGSAQLCLPAGGLTLAELQDAVQRLLRSGATIDEVNTVRRRIDAIKGGGLARAIAQRVDAARVEVLVLSDVLGDPLHAVSSGPTVDDPTTAADALDVLGRYGLSWSMPGVVAAIQHCEREDERQAAGPVGLRHTVIANNPLAIEAAARLAEDAGLRVVEQRSLVTGEASAIGNQLASRAIALGAGEAVVWGGETTVCVGDASGRGGRNQEAVLAAAIVLEGHAGVGVASIGTDGVDGPTDAAGAAVDGASAARMRGAGIDPDEALSRHDSHGALDAAGGLVRTGPSGTNLNDVMVGVRWA